MLFDVEPEIQDGQRAFPATQVLFQGRPRTLQIANPVECSWYGTVVSEYRGAFCFVQEGEGLGDLVGEFLQIASSTNACTCYCLGETPEIPTPIAVTRRAFMNFGILTQESVLVYIGAVD